MSQLGSEGREALDPLGRCGAGKRGADGGPILLRLGHARQLNYQGVDWFGAWRNADRPFRGFRSFEKQSTCRFSAAFPTRLICCSES